MQSRRVQGSVNRWRIILQALVMSRCRDSTHTVVPVLSDISVFFGLSDCCLGWETFCFPENRLKQMSWGSGEMVQQLGPRKSSWITGQFSVQSGDAIWMSFFKDIDAGSRKRWLTIMSGKIIVESFRKEDTSAGSVIYFSDAGFSFMTNDTLEERASFTKARLLIMCRIYHHTSLKGSWWKECESFVHLNVYNFMNFWDELKWDTTGRNNKEHVFF